MDETEVLSRLKAVGDTEELSVTLTANEWAAVSSLLHLAIEAGCPSTNARTARDRIGKQIMERWDEDDILNESDIG
jgi:hypothetical protein